MLSCATVRIKVNLSVSIGEFDWLMMMKRGQEDHARRC